MKEERDSDQRYGKKNEWRQEVERTEECKDKIAWMKVWKDENQYERNKEIIEGNLNRLEKRAE